MIQGNRDTLEISLIGNNTRFYMDETYRNARYKLSMIARGIGARLLEDRLQNGVLMGNKTLRVSEIFMIFDNNDHCMYVEIPLNILNGYYININGRDINARSLEEIDYKTREIGLANICSIGYYSNMGRNDMFLNYVDYDIRIVNNNISLGLKVLRDLI